MTYSSHRKYKWQLENKKMLIRKPLTQNNNSTPSVKKNVSLIGDFVIPILQ